jgi:hypothetical protein
METGGVIYLALCAAIFVYLSLSGRTRTRPLGWKMKWAAIGARALLALIVIPVTILMCIEWLVGFRVLQVRQDP